QVSIIGGIPQTPSTAKGDVFYKATFSINYLGGQLILSGSPDGTGYTYVDDVLYMKVTHPDGTVSTLTNNYYASGCTAKKDLPSMDIASKFMPGVNKVYVEFRDKCGGNVDASSMWLSNF
ncbi:hypothetical protein, partial [Ideonella sp.]|uniref:hypothetical protein n=1 Tax=Ideonella sp. TaxID=1929293 RepID=UPI003BB7868A